LNEKNDIVETATDSVADARGPIQIACSRIFIPVRRKYLTGQPRVTLRLFSC
jgi:hypothetical protein